MRVTSPPAALSIAAALAVLTLLAHPSSAGAGRWQRPVPGEVARSFDYSPAAPFATGAHRGADLAAAPGDQVGAACAGVVLHAGPVPGGASAVTLRCGDRRVTHMPLRRPAVRRGVRVRAGDRIGTLGAGHGGLHLGVRAAVDPFAYEDPIPLLSTPRSPLPTPPSTRRPSSPRRPAPTPLMPPSRIPRALPARTPSMPPSKVRHRRPASAPSMPPFEAPPPTADVRAQRPLAPPLTWAGLALAALATAGTGMLFITRRHARYRHSPGPRLRAGCRRPTAVATRRRTP